MLKQVQHDGHLTRNFYIVSNKKVLPFGRTFLTNKHHERLSALAVPATGTFQAAFFVDESVISALRAGPVFAFGSVWYIFLQRSFHTCFPCIDRFIIQAEVTNKVNYIRYRHSMAKHTGNKFCIVPEFFIK